MIFDNRESPEEAIGAGTIREITEGASEDEGIDIHLDTGWTIRVHSTTLKQED